MPRDFKRQFLAGISMDVGLSDGLYSLVKYGRRWNTYARNALGDVLLIHHQQVIPRHFELGAHSKYGYATRRDSTRQRKYYYWHRHRDQDLVRSGQMARYVISNYNISFRGAYGSDANPGTLVGRLNMRLPHPLAPGKNGGIGPDEIAKEITATTPWERQQMGLGFIRRVTAQVNAYHGPTKYLGGTPRRSTFPRTVL